MSSKLDGNHDLTFESINDLIKSLEQSIKCVENKTEILITGAEEFVMDLKKLPKPISKIKKSGYTHIIDTFAYRVNKKEVEVGWGKYYGRMLEDGTKNMSPRRHLNPLWERNKEKYYKKMLSKTNFI